VPFDVKIPRLAYLMIGRTADGRLEIGFIDYKLQLQPFLALIKQEDMMFEYIYYQAAALLHSGFVLIMCDY